MAQDIVFRLLAETEKARKEIEAFRKQSEKAIKSTESSFSGLKKQTSVVAQGFASLAGNLAANAISSGFSAISGAVTSFASESLAAGRTFEDLNTRLVTLTGSTGAANELFAELKDFSAGTPFQLPDITNAAAQLRSFGTELNQIIPTLESIGNVSAASGSNLGELSLIFGQVRAAGKLTGERLLQFQERAVPIGPAIAKTLGVAEASVKDLVSQGKVSFDQFEQAFNSLSEEGEFAFNGILRASLTFSGALSTLSDNATIFKGTFGEVITGSNDAKATLAGFSAVFQELTKIVEDNQEELQGFIGTISDAIPRAFGIAGESIIVARNVIDGFRLVFNSLTAGVVSGVSLIVSQFESLVGSAASIASALDIDVPGLQAASDSITEFRENLDGTVQETVKDFDEIVESNENFANTVRDVTTRVSGAYSKATTEFKKSATEQALADAQRIEIIKANAAEEEQINQKRITDAKKVIESLGDNTALEEKFQKENELLRLSLEQQLITKAEFDELELIQKQEFNNKVLEQQGAFNQGLAGAREANLLLANEQEIRLVDAQIAQKKRLNQNTKLLEEKKRQIEFNSNKARIGLAQSFFGDLQTLSAGSNRSLFEATKAVNIGLATIQGALAVNNALATPPFPLGLALAAVAAARAAVQIKQISSASFQKGITEIPQGFPNDSLLAGLSSGERVVDANANADLKQFLANQNAGPGESAPSGGDSGTAEAINRLASAIESQSQQDIVVNVNDQELIRAVRGGLRGGGSLAV